MWYNVHARKVLLAVAQKIDFFLVLIYLEDTGMVIQSVGIYDKFTQSRNYQNLRDQEDWTAQEKEPRTIFWFRLMEVGWS